MNKRNRLIIHIPITKLEIISNLLSLLFIIGSIIYILVEWHALPGKIPMHYNAAGEVDRFGNKAGIWAFPSIQLALWILLTCVERFPHKFNYFFEVTEKNREQQYKNSRLMINLMKTEIMFFFCNYIWQGVEGGFKHKVGLGVWEFPLFIIIIFGTIIFFVIRSFRYK